MDICRYGVALNLNNQRQSIVKEQLPKKGSPEFKAEYTADSSKPSSN